MRFSSHPPFTDCYPESSPAQLFPTTMAVGVVGGCSAITAGAVPHTVLTDRLAGDLVLAMEGSVLLGLEPIVVEDVEGIVRGFCPLLRDGKKDAGRCLAC